MVEQRLEDLLHALEQSRGARLWYGGATLLGALRGVRAPEAVWTPPGWRNSIWCLTLHCAYTKYIVWRKLSGVIERGGFPRAGGYWPPLPDPADDAAWLADQTLLRDEHRGLVEAAEEFDPVRLDDPSGEGSPHTFADLLVGVIMHDTYHTGQIQVLKRLWAAQVMGEE
jgi:hypothetical protein